MGFNPPDGGNVFQFGPFLWTQGGTEYDTPLSWTNADYLLPPVNKTFFFGCMSGGLNAWNYQWFLTNNTPSTGYAYAVQLVRIPEPPEVTYAKTPYNLHEFSPVVGEKGSDGYVVKVPSPKDASGNVQWGVDGETDFGQFFPWAYNSDAYTQFPANSGVLAVPPADSIRDLNGVLQSFYSDSPNRRFPVTRFTLGMVIEMNVNWRFVTHIVWHPDEGIPISLAQYRWALDCNEYNPTADLNPTTLAAMQTPGNWDLSKTFQTLGDNSFVTAYLEWFYNQWDYRDNVNPSVWTKRPGKASGGGPNLAPMGSGPMGAAVTVPNFGNQALLPRGAAANVGSMNSV